MIKNKRECRTCGKDISKRAGNAVYCFPCLYKRENQKSKESGRRKRKDFVADKKCIFCGSVKDLQGHHSDMDKRNNTQDNFIFLCMSCHSKVHFRILRPFIRNIAKSLKAERFGVTQIAKIIGLSRQRIYKILEKVE